jgi:hypothetical protein
MKILTIDRALKILQKAKEQFGGNGEAALILSLTDSGIPDATVNDMFIQNEDGDQYVEVQVRHSYIAEQ